MNYVKKIVIWEESDYFEEKNIITGREKKWERVDNKEDINLTLTYVQTRRIT